MNEPQAWTPYCGAAPSPAELLARWNFDPLLLLALVAAGGIYAWRAGEARHRRHRFAAAIALLAILFISPFCALTSALFAARVVHHVALTAVAAPLIVLAFASERIRPAGGLATWTALHALVFWLWHAPPIYAWALSGDAAYWLMQATLLGSAFGFWAALRRSPALAGVGALLATMVQMGLLGALITFSGGPLYAPHLVGPQLWGFSPLEDQQLAGLIMWAPAAGLYLAAALVLLGRWLRREARPALP
ncbi:cytochrome c oxidase assembly protein [Sphingomonas gilva]|uniref:Cytochrome c oxidase assembly protein n=1 Tax=Sphingomonas gilva TaxID=2305907 RepID=A0A396RK85_9SPHN|nr:cytochrome c oxidase assembly protein [Sphingomonas gilva]RHW16449.1 cytochrome c oxidase assembly protein [Sphingomonas gilva]